MSPFSFKGPFLFPSPFPRSLPPQSMEIKVISSGVRYSSLPESYVRPESERPKLSEVAECENFPVIDLGCRDRSVIVQQIGDACQQFGFFQAINHGVSMEAVEKMIEVAHEFFRLPVEEKLKLYSDDPSKTMRLSTSFNVKKETVHNWRDYLRLHCYPLEKFVTEWPSNPSTFKWCERITLFSFEDTSKEAATFSSKDICPKSQASPALPCDRPQPTWLFQKQGPTSMALLFDAHKIRISSRAL
ncbi:unnamed protein product [Ilex paraguariensis]|uniref:Non-haem dioxygenase N-terminal domain-containing protein n=1 Tax=Ilex paraguariensis TaxID=185542 RepID=A0ABC8RZ34_9AQUA